MKAKSHPKLIEIPAIHPRAVQFQLYIAVTPFKVIWPIFISFDTVSSIQKYETVKYIPSPFGGDGNVLAKSQVIPPYFTWRNARKTVLEAAKTIQYPVWYFFT